eukprot:TRINITY_DN111802_c0_g1_i1.p1 TRINITY_DN111802_c0_g1~~TRINITY_DN111802_c0_g1_i1.p1  ORF type:complete len:141 (-),score=41.87 TRINITY_DN111802_c0_g1_i1:200-622(-)
MGVDFHVCLECAIKQEKNWEEHWKRERLQKEAEARQKAAEQQLLAGSRSSGSASRSGRSLSSASGSARSQLSALGGMVLSRSASEATMEQPIVPGRGALAKKQMGMRKFALDAGLTPARFVGAMELMKAKKAEREANHID